MLRVTWDRRSIAGSYFASIASVVIKVLYYGDDSFDGVPYKWSSAGRRSAVENFGSADILSPDG